MIQIQEESMMRDEELIELYDIMSNCVSEIGFIPRSERANFVANKITNADIALRKLCLYCFWDVYQSISSGAEKATILAKIKRYESMAKNDGFTLKDLIDLSYKLYADIVKDETRQRHIVNDKPEAIGDDKPLDNYAFADHRRDVPKEKDNDLEQRMYGALKNHFESSKTINDNDGKLMMKLIQNGQYAKIFKKPKGITVYRGMSVSEEYLRKCIDGKVSFEGQKFGKYVRKLINKQIPTRGQKAGRFEFIPHKGKFASSWTSDKDTAVGFSYSRQHDDFTYALILEANVDENDGSFIAGPDGLYNVPEFSNYEHENEYLGLGTIKVSKIEWEEIRYE